MGGPLEGYITLQEAADLLGVSRQTVTRRAAGQSMDTLGQLMDSNLDSPGQSLDSPGPSLDSSLDSPAPSTQTMQQRIRQLEKDLLAAQVEAAALRATVKAQEAHIDSLQRALDAEQAIHMASLQKRLTAPGRGFMDWIRGRGKKQNDR